MEKDKFIAVIEDNQNLIYKICYSYCSNPEDIKDLQQEILIQLWNSFSKFDGRVKISTWIYRIALYTAISFYRKDCKQNNNKVALDTSSIPLATSELDSDFKENIEMLYQLIECLNDLDKALILLYLDDISYKGIADILGISETNVATKINRIKKNLRNDLVTFKTKVMELDDFKGVWAQFDKKLSENTELNMELLIHNKLNSSKSELQKLYNLAIREIIIGIIVIVYLIINSFHYLEEPEFYIPGFISVSIFMVYLLFSIITVKRFLSIDYIGSPVVKLRKDILKLNMWIKRTRKYEYFLLPILLFSFIPIAYKSILDLNIYNDIKGFTLEALILLVFALGGTVLMNHYFIDRKINNANRILEELDKFEQEE